jgi:hypothetical protein
MSGSDLAMALEAITAMKDGTLPGGEELLPGCVDQPPPQLGGVSNRPFRDRSQSVTESGSIRCFQQRERKIGQDWSGCINAYDERYND